MVTAEAEKACGSGATAGASAPGLGEPAWGQGRVQGSGGGALKDPCIRAQKGRKEILGNRRTVLGFVTTALQN